jgi:hypothetical protein
MHFPALSQGRDFFAGVLKNRRYNAADVRIEYGHSSLRGSEIEQFAGRKIHHRYRAVS